jgi:PAS domain S-box-containing protein
MIWAAGAVSAQPRSWTATEVDLFEDAVERTWAAVERARAEEALRESEAWLTAQKEAFQVAMNGESLETSLAVLVRTAVEQSSGKGRAAFYLMNQDGTALRHLIGMPDDYARHVDGFVVSPESLACGLATYRGEPVITPDVEDEPRWKPWLWLAREYKYRACWSFPVRTDGGPILGTLAWYFEEPRQPSPREKQLAAVLTHTAAIIISRQQETDDHDRAEKALHASEERMHTLANGLPHLVWSANPEGAIDFVNERVHEYAEMARSKEGIYQWQAIIHPDDREMALCQWEEGMRAQEAFEFDGRLHMKDGTYRWHLVRGTPTHDANGSLSRWYGTMTDIEQIKTHEHQESQAASPASLTPQSTREERH